MPATPRDLFKSHTQRVAETTYLAQLQAGQANSQQVVSGLVAGVGATQVYQVDVSAGEAVILGQLVSVAAVTQTALPAGATTSASQYANLLVELAWASLANGAVVTPSVVITAGAYAASAAAAVTPPINSGRLALAVIAVPPSFTYTSSTLLTAWFTPVAYDAGFAPDVGF
jgi:hypothetical protein